MFGELNRGGASAESTVREAHSTTRIVCTHIIRLPLRRLPHPLRPLLPSLPLPLAEPGSGFDRTFGRHGSPPIPPVNREDGFMYALRLQREYDDEDRALSVQRTQLANCSDSFVRSLPSFA